MAIFPVIENEAVIQTFDKTRIDLSKSHVTPNESAISAVHIRPSQSDDYIVITSTDREDWYLDWQYSTVGYKTITAIVVAGGASAQFSTTAYALDETEDKLFSNDQDLKLHEPDILKWMPVGRATFKDMHRRAQNLIMKWLDKEGYVDAFNQPFTKDHVIDIEEVNMWSTYLVLRLIFEGMSNAVDDIFHKKAKYYTGKMAEYRKKSLLRVDTNKDGIQDEHEGITTQHGFVARR